MQIKTQFGSTRPYGVGFLFGGWDKNYGFQLYNTEPSGIYNAWRAHAIGKNDQSAQSSLKQYYENDMNLNDGLKLAVKVLKKSLDKNKMNPENVEIFVLEKKGEELCQRFVKSDEIQTFIQIVDKEDAEEKERKNKSITKKEKLSKKFFNKNLINGESRVMHIPQKKIKSTKQGINHNLEIFENKNKENNGEKEKYKMYKTRKSDFIRTTNKNNSILGMTDSPKKKAKRKSIISQPNVSPSKIYTTEIFQKFFSKKISLRILSTNSISRELAYTRCVCESQKAGITTLPFTS